MTTQSPPNDVAYAAPYSAQYAVCILAHNEEKRIVACLESLPLADPAFDFFIVVNGSKDRTAQLAEDYSRQYPNCQVHDLKAGGKSLTWNHYVFEIMPPDKQLYFFLDGDAVLQNGSLQAIVQTAKQHEEESITPALHAIAGLPLNGRRAAYYQRHMVENGALFGDLYALTKDFMTRIRKANYRLPDDLIGDDSMLGSWARTDLKSDAYWNKNHVAVCLEAGFYAEPLSPFNPAHIILQFKRMINYSVRHFQNQTVKAIMQKEGVKDLPNLINPPTAARLRPHHIRLHPLWFIFDCLAFRRIKKAADKKGEGKKSE